VTVNPQKEEMSKPEMANYTLPDGSAIEIGHSRYRAPELLFHPDVIGEEYEGIHEVLTFAVQKSDLDLRRTLYSNIVLSGGSTLFRGLHCVKICTSLYVREIVSSTDLYVVLINCGIQQCLHHCAMLVLTVTSLGTLSTKYRGRSCDLLLNFAPTPVSPERLKLETSNLYVYTG